MLKVNNSFIFQHFTDVERGNSNCEQIMYPGHHEQIKRQFSEARTSFSKELFTNVNVTVFRWRYLGQCTDLT